MVEPIGSKLSSLPVQRVVPATPAAAPERVAPATVEAPVQGIAGTARALAAEPPVDPERVARIKKAIADGRFPILPATVADRLLAFSLEWNPNDAA
jgi:negative regulator of flagellin synthesis FlgM